MAVAALVLGIIALLASLIPFGLIIGVPLAIAAIVCGIIGLRRGLQRGMSIAGLVMGVLSLLVATAYVVLFAFLVESGPGFLEQVVDEAQLSGGVMMTTSPCDGEDATAFEGPLAGGSGDVTVHTVEACPDFADDVQFGVELENTGADPVEASVSVTGLAGGETVTEPSPEDIALEPGARGWVQIITFDEWQELDEVSVNLDTF